MTDVEAKQDIKVLKQKVKIQQYKPGGKTIKEWQQMFCQRVTNTSHQFSGQPYKHVRMCIFITKLHNKLHHTFQLMPSLQRLHLGLDNDLIYVVLRNKILLNPTSPLSTTKNEKQSWTTSGSSPGAAAVAVVRNVWGKELEGNFAWEWFYQKETALIFFVNFISCVSLHHFLLWFC